MTKARDVTRIKHSHATDAPMKQANVQREVPAARDEPTPAERETASQLARFLKSWQGARR